MSKRRHGGGSVTKYTYRTKTRTYTKWRYQIWEPVDYYDSEGEKQLVGRGGFDTAKEAESALSEHRRRIEKRVQVTRTKTPFKEFAENWLDSLNLANSTVAGYRKIVETRLLPQLGKNDLKDLTPYRINKHYAFLLREGGISKANKGKGLSPNTVKKTHDVLSAILDAAVLERRLATNPAKDPAVKPPRANQIKAAKPEIHVWDKKQLNGFLEWARTRHKNLWELWEIAAHTGMRRGELLALQWGDFDPSNGKISVRRAVDGKGEKGATKLPKNGKARVIDLLPSDIALLNKRKAERARISFEFIKADAYIFGTNEDNRLRSGDNVSAAFVAQVKEARATRNLQGLPLIHFHELRHTHATQLLLVGVQPKVVQERLGHATISITLDIYSHVLPSMQKDAVERLGEMLA